MTPAARKSVGWFLCCDLRGRLRASRISLDYDGFIAIAGCGCPDHIVKPKQRYFAFQEDKQIVHSLDIDQVEKAAPFQSDDVVK